jgi:hypothetical protein
MGNSRNHAAQEYLDELDANETMFHSAQGEYDVFDAVSQSFIVTDRAGRDSLQEKAREQLAKKNTREFADILPVEKGEFRAASQKHWDRKQEILSSAGFKAFPIIDTAPTRDVLPALKDPKETLNIWALIKDCNPTPFPSIKKIQALVKI